MKSYKIVKRIEAKSIKDAIKRESRSEMIEVFEENKHEINDKQVGFNNKKK